LDVDASVANVSWANGPGKPPRTEPRGSRPRSRGQPAAEVAEVEAHLRAYDGVVPESDAEAEFVGMRVAQLRACLAAARRRARGSTAGR
jgi:hypothetical protein